MIEITCDKCGEVMGKVSYDKKTNTVTMECLAEGNICPKCGHYRPFTWDDYRRCLKITPVANLVIGKKLVAGEEVNEV